MQNQALEMDRAGRADFGRQYLTGSFYLYHSVSPTFALQKKQTYIQ